MQNFNRFTSIDKTINAPITLLMPATIPNWSASFRIICDFYRKGGRLLLLRIRSMILAIGISVLIGAASGAVPAYQASKLKPVDALRYE